MRGTRRLATALGLAALLASAGCGSNSTQTGRDNGSSAPGVTQPSSSAQAAGSGDTSLVVLQDDQHLQTVDNIVPVVNSKVVSAPLVQALDKVSAALTTADLIGLNRMVDVQRRTPSAVALQYARDKGLTSGLSGGRGSVSVAAAGFSENQVLANLFVDALKAAGFTATVKPVTNREVYEPALESGQVQVAAEYVGTLTEFLNKKVNGPTAAAKASGSLVATTAALRALAGRRGLTVLRPSQAADQNAFAVTRSFATQNHLTTLSQLAAYRGPLVLGGPPECPTRPFCQPGLQRTYGIHFTGFSSLDAGGPLTKAALTTGKVQIGLVFSSDGSLAPQG